MIRRLTFEFDLNVPENTFFLKRLPSKEDTTTESSALEFDMVEGEFSDKALGRAFRFLATGEGIRFLKDGSDEPYPRVVVL